MKMAWANSRESEFFGGEVSDAFVCLLFIPANAGCVQPDWDCGAIFLYLCQEAASHRFVVFPSHPKKFPYRLWSL